MGLLVQGMAPAHDRTAVLAAGHTAVLEVDRNAVVADRTAVLQVDRVDRNAAQGVDRVDCRARQLLAAQQGVEETGHNVVNL